MPDRLSVTSPCKTAWVGESLIVAGKGYSMVDTASLILLFGVNAASLSLFLLKKPSREAYVLRM